jgi:hypothetical protein
MRKTETIPILLLIFSFAARVHAHLATLANRAAIEVALAHGAA